MSQEKVQEAAAVAAEQDEQGMSDADFDSGFGSPGVEQQPAAPTETPDVKPDANTAQPEAQIEPEMPETPAPKFAQITEDDYRSLLAKAAKVDELQSKIDVSFGRFGNKLQSLAEQLQSATPRGAKVEITDEMVGELASEFPEMGALVRKTLEKFSEKLTGTAPAAIRDQEVAAATAAPAQDPAALEGIRTEAVKQAKREIAEETLDGTHEGWREVIGLPDAQGNVPDTPFRKWLATQPQDYQDRVKASYSAVSIGKAIDLFRESQRKSQAEAEQRKARMTASATPRGSGGHATAANTEDDEFNAGFRGS